MANSKVAIFKTNPESIYDDCIKAMELTGLNNTLDKEKTTILKDNISWHLPMPSAIQHHGN